MKILLLWTAIAVSHPRILLTIDQLEPPPQPEEWVCPVMALGSDVPEQSGTWRFTPDVLVCDRGPVTMSRVQRAVGYWEALGYTFGSVRQATPDHFGCATNKVPFNTIMIDIPSQSFKMGTHLGSTKTWRNAEANRIIKAKIEIIPAWGATERILEHEFGHALGWNDIHHTGHIMNGAWSLGGFGSEGLRK